MAAALILYWPLRGGPHWSCPYVLPGGGPNGTRGNQRRQEAKNGAHTPATHVSAGVVILRLLSTAVLVLQTLAFIVVWATRPTWRLSPRPWAKYVLFATTVYTSVVPVVATEGPEVHNETMTVVYRLAFQTFLGLAIFPWSTSQHRGNTSWARDSKSTGSSLLALYWTYLFIYIYIYIYIRRSLLGHTTCPPLPHGGCPASLALAWGQDGTRTQDTGHRTRDGTQDGTRDGTWDGTRHGTREKAASIGDGFHRGLLVWLCLPPSHPSLWISQQCGAAEGGPPLLWP